MIRFITFIIWMVINSTKPSAIQADTLHISAQQTYTAGIDTLTQEAITQLDTLYKLKAKEIVMQRHRTLIKRMAITICIMTSVILSSSLLLWVGWRHLRTHKNKLQPTNANFDDLPCNNRQLKPSEEATIDEIPEPTGLFTESSETDTYLFKRIERLVKDEKLYLNPNLSRQDILNQLSINKNLFSRIMQKHLQMTLPEYLSYLRVQHAIQLMNEQPNFSTQALAEESGFKNIRNFQRNFKSVTGMTFTEFKEQYNGGGRNACLSIDYEQKRQKVTS